MNRERNQSGLYLMRSNWKTTKISNFGNMLKGYLTSIKKETPGIISDKINPESDMGIWISGRRG